MSTIEWLVNEHGIKGKSWNALEGCDPVSPGCLHCYAAAVASRGMHWAHRGITRFARRRNEKGQLVNLPVFNGTVLQLEERLTEPLRWKKPRRVFVNSMSDLFHEAVSFSFIAAHLGVIACCPHLTFLALTKRDPRPFFERVEELASQLAIDEVGVLQVEGRRHVAQLNEDRDDTVWPMDADPSWPLPNLQLLVSAETQPYFDQRVAWLRECPATVRGVSLEPLLGPIDIRSQIDHLDWVIVGGESGPASRPCHVEWIEQIVSQCVAANKPVFVKQLGGNPYVNGEPFRLADAKGGNIDEWTGVLHVLRRRELVPSSWQPPPSPANPQLEIF